MEQSIKFYDKVYPLYLGDGLREQIVDSFPILEELDGFIGFGSCGFTFMGKQFNNYIGFANPIYREMGGLKLAKGGIDMSKVAVAEEIKLKNPMPIYKEYRNDPKFRKYIHAKLKLYNDRVVLTNDELIKIITSVQEAMNKNQIAVYELYNLDELPLPNVSIILGTRTYNFAVNKHEKTITFERYLLSNLIWRVVLKPVLNSGEQMVETGVGVEFISPVMVNKDDLEYTDFINIFLAVNYFIKHIPSSYQETKKKVAETIEVGKGHSKKYKQVVHLEREYNFDNLKKITKTHLRHIFTCLCWGVRGHIRHYKNGKTIFIQPFKKGKERNNMEAFSGKEYKL